MIWRRSLRGGARLREVPAKDFDWEIFGVLDKWSLMHIKVVVYEKWSHMEIRLQYANSLHLPGDHR